MRDDFISLTHTKNTQADNPKTGCLLLECALFWLWFVLLLENLIWMTNSQLQIELWFVSVSCANVQRCFHCSEGSKCMCICPDEKPVWWVLLMQVCVGVLSFKLFKLTYYCFYWGFLLIILECVSVTLIMSDKNAAYSFSGCGLMSAGLHFKPKCFPAWLNFNNT